MKKQLGQAMVEYTIVTMALVSAFFLTVNDDCDGGNCISKLLTVMHDNYEGYSASMSSVQKYGEFAVSDSSGGSDDGSGGGDDGSGDGGGSGSTSGPTELNPDGLTEVNLVEGKINNFSATFGYLRDDGTVVNADGDFLGTYSEEDGTYTDSDGVVHDNIKIETVIVDEAGNILEIRAVTDCTTGQVYSWAYVSKDSGKVFNTLNQDEMPIGDLCTTASFKVVKNGVEQSGRMVNGYYYATALAVEVSDSPLSPTGEVVYWADLNSCSAMVTGWDASVDYGDDDDDIYEEQYKMFSDDDANIGQIDQYYYATQAMDDHYGDNVSFSNDCPSSRVIHEP